MATFLAAVTLGFHLVPSFGGPLRKGAVAPRCLRHTASLIFLMGVVVGSGPPYAQRHEADEFASLRGEVSELYIQGKFTEAIPLAERYFALVRHRHGRGYPEFETAIGLLASVYYAQAVRCLGAETRPGELLPGAHSP
jgi:hypothetical protein